MRTVIGAAVAAALLHAGAWIATHEVIAPPDVDSVIESVSYNFIGPVEGAKPPTERQVAAMRRDLALVAGVARSVRTYAASGVHSAVPGLARESGLGVTLGAWVDADKKKSRREIEAAVELANRYPNVRGIVVGNETILRQEFAEDELIAMLREVRQRVRAPVSTGETWDLWLKHPRLANEVDFIAAHILPYWESIPDHHAVAYALDRYEALREAFPGKRIVIAEFGWPSRGYNNRASAPDPLAQARILREFVAEAKRRGIPYNVVEAIDQTWKVNEGSVGPYWGLYDADRRPKFSLAGTVDSEGRSGKAVLALALGALIAVAGLLGQRPTFPQAVVFAAAANALAAAVAVAVAYPFENYLNFGATLAWSVGMVLMIPLTVVTLTKIHEVAEVTLGRPPRRLWRGLPPGRRPSHWPKVSIQIPAYREPPEMLKETLTSVAALDYPDFEVLVIVNNTPEEAQWRPVEEHCRRLGPRFKFLNLPQVEGFKAGALNLAMRHVAPDAEVLALLDADYVVDRRWLKDLVPAFEDPRVAVVQAPQDHRDGERGYLHRVMNAEYAGFFDIGMVQRNEDDAIVVHGTMLLLRRTAFELVGGWLSDTITEDTELGLRLFEAGYGAVYTDRRYGWGLLPEDFRAFKTQRHRWAYGAVQIMRKHKAHLLPQARTLKIGQKGRYAAGWTYWLSDSIGAVAALANLCWVPVIVFVGVLLPPVPFTLPILAAFAVSLLHCALLYATRVGLSPGRIAGAALAAASLQWTIARAVFDGVVRDNLPFRRTDKGGGGARGSDHPARFEIAIGLALVCGALTLGFTNVARVTEVTLLAFTLGVQSLPFLAAGVMYALERMDARAAEPALIPAAPEPLPAPVAAE